DSIHLSKQSRTEDSGLSVAPLKIERIVTTNHEPRTTNHEPRTTNHEPRTTNHEPRTTNHEPPTTNHEPRTTNHEPRTNHAHPQNDRPRSRGQARARPRRLERSVTGWGHQR